MDTTYIGETCRDHEATDGHVWLDTGQFCCLNWPADHKQQRCYCNAMRWVARLPLASAQPGER